MSHIKAVREEWDAVCAALGVTEQGWIDSEWSKILRAYCDGRRKYHDMGHIAYGLDLIRIYPGPIDDVIALKYGWINHDRKYLAHPRPKEIPTSEAWSAAISDEALAELNRQELVLQPIPMAFRQRVVGHINVTHHNKDFLPKMNDEMLMADIDFSPMGAPWEEFLRNRKAIRVEYGQYTDKEFAAGRAGFISNLKGRDSYFYLPWFKERYDEQLKENLRKEVELLALSWDKQAEIMAEV